MLRGLKPITPRPMEAATLVRRNARLDMFCMVALPSVFGYITREVLCLMLDEPLALIDAVIRVP